MSRDYGHHLRQLLPRGPIWDSLGANIQSILDGIAVELARIDARGIDLEAEMDPATATELLPAWEAAVGLPDPDCGTPPAGLQDRRNAASARYIARGQSAGSGVLFLRKIAESMGYVGDDFVIRRFHRQPFTCQSRCIDALNTRDTGWLALYEFIATHSALDAQLQCEINRKVAAHLVSTFAFPLLQSTDLTYSHASPSTLIHPRSGEQTALAIDEVGQFYIGS